MLNNDKFLRIEGVIATGVSNYDLLNWNVPTSLKKQTRFCLGQHKNLGLCKSNQAKALKKVNCQVMKSSIINFIKEVLKQGAITLLR